ncbi:hypothetical protein [Vulgatibacter incomptus]|nr:hypothetical protein [Vulgatibacter incomptus]
MGWQRSRREVSRARIGEAAQVGAAVAALLALAALVWFSGCSGGR